MTSISPAIQSSIDSQLQSPFFSIPAEIRETIYEYIIENGIHTCIHNGKLQFAACVQPDPHGDYDGYERLPPGHDIMTDDAWMTDQLFAKRLMSSWGPHCKCEELIMGFNDEDGESAKSERKHVDLGSLRACKRMSFEVVNCMDRNGLFYITNLASLESILLGNPLLTSSPSVVSPYTKLTSSLKDIKRLDITAQLNLNFYRTLVNPELSSTDTMDRAEALRRSWILLPLVINQLPKLRSLTIWLDHTGSCSWALAKERAVLSTLNGWTGNAGLDVTISLPEIREDHFSSSIHLDSEEESRFLPIQITRHTRQIVFGDHRVHGYTVSTACTLSTYVEEEILTFLEDENPRPWLYELDMQEMKDYLEMFSGCTLGNM